MAEVQQTDGKASEKELEEREADGLARELAAANARLQELKDADAHPNVLAEAKQRVENAVSELERIGKAVKKTRPAGAGKKTR